MSTKQQLISNALEDIGLSLPIDSSQLRIGHRELRNMCNSLESKGVYVGYNNSSPDLISNESGISLANEDAITKGLAVRMAEILDVVISPGYLNRAQRLLGDLSSVVIPQCWSNPILPNGAGGRVYNTSVWVGNYQNPDKIHHVNSGETVKAEAQLKNNDISGSIVSAAWSANTATISIANESLAGALAAADVSFSAVGDYVVKIQSTYDTGEIDVTCIKYQVSECRKSPSRRTEITSGG